MSNFYQVYFIEFSNFGLATARIVHISNQLRAINWGVKTNRYMNKPVSITYYEGYYVGIYNDVFEQFFTAQELSTKQILPGHG